MKLAVVNNCVPFVAGGAEHLAEALTQKLREYGHEAVLIRIPFRWEPPAKIIESMLACRLLRLPNVDRVVALKFPAYLVPHPEKMLWLLHQFRQAYDLWGTRFQGLPDTPEGRRIRDVIVEADNRFLRQVRKIYTNSQVTSDRLRRFNGIDSEVLLPPLADTSQFFCAGYGDYILYPGRITASKRQLLAVEAMRYVTTDVRLVIAGRHEAPADLAQIEAVIEQHRLAHRVEVIARFISEEEKVALLSRALACAYFPYDEDSYGYVTLEAFYSRKPVITCSDSGGVCMVVKDAVTGHVTLPDPQAVAAAMDRLYLDRTAARRMGEAGLELLWSLQIGWDRVIEALTQ
jgi:glycosyltransferase involved in cell wall biosynthesis